MTLPRAESPTVTEASVLPATELEALTSEQESRPLTQGDPSYHEVLVVCDI